MKKLLVIVALLLVGAFSYRAITQRDVAAQLRIANVGVRDISGLTVLFPESEVEFGDLPTGSTTAYEMAPGGVYGYAAFRLDVEGEIIIQGVMDWLGAEPMRGYRFTYEVSFDPTLGQPLTLVEVKRDE